MNGVNEEKYQLRLTQTAKGVFYVDRVGITGDEQDVMVKDMERLAGSVIMLLEKLNSGQIEREQIKEQ